MTNEASIAWDKIDIRWLTIIFQKACQERKVSGDWEKFIVVPIWKRVGNI